ncbi:MAG: hypothetical protein NZM00_09575 [Anaerolinea sp.]|nr:hypothetical protein [Anaerolinea sp.]
MYLIRSTHWHVGIEPELGGAITYGLIRVGSGWYDLLRPTPVGAALARDTSSFIMAPWCNRIRSAVFTFNGQTYQLEANFQDGTAIHGICRNYPWHVTSVSAGAITLDFDSRPLDRPNYPVAFTSRQIYRVMDNRFSIELSVTTVDSVAIPVGFGHHTYFQRTLTGPDDGAELEIPCAEAWELEEGLPTGAIHPVDARTDFRQRRPLADTVLDDLLTERSPGEPVRLFYPKHGVEVRFHADPVYRHLVVYAPPGKPFYAVEPVSNANDGYNQMARGNPRTGVIVLDPGATASGTMTLEVIGG